MSSSNFSDGTWHLSSIDKGPQCPLGPPGKMVKLVKSAGGWGYASEDAASELILDDEVEE